LYLSLVLAFTVGFFSAIHCFGMCGGIVGALSLSLPAAVRARPASLLGYVLLYNLGRILVYVLLGLLVGAGGRLLGWGVGDELWRQVAGAVAAVTLVLVGLYLTDWFPPLRRMDRLGNFLWRRLEPVARRILPIRNYPGALLAGLVWGWLPCGLVYYALFLTLPLGSSWKSGLFMLAFGLGTLPAMLATGALTGWLTRLGRNRRLRQAAGLILALFGLGMLLFGLEGFLIPSPVPAGN
jgi:sulfite exporter TauE/SafE